VKERQARKRALAQESEAYRQALRVEVHNLRLYAANVQQKLMPLRTFAPLFMLSAPLAGSFLRKRKPKWLRLAESGLVGWGLYRRFGRMLQDFVSQRRDLPRFSASEQTPPT